MVVMLCHCHIIIYVAENCLARQQRKATMWSVWVFILGQSGKIHYKVIWGNPEPPRFRTILTLTRSKSFVEEGEGVTYNLFLSYHRYCYLLPPSTRIGLGKALRFQVKFSNYLLQDWDHQIPWGRLQRNHWDLADLPWEDCRGGGPDHPPLLPHWCRLPTAGWLLRGLWGDGDPGGPTGVVHSQPAGETLANIKQNAGDIILLNIYITF